MTGNLHFDFTGEDITPAPDATAQEPTAPADAPTGEAVVDQDPGEAPEVPADTLAVPEPAAVSLKDQSFREALFAEYAKDGKLSDATLAKLESAGIPKDLVEDYVASKVAASAAQTEATNRQIFKACGGVEAVKEALQWASENLDKPAQTAINAQLSSGNVAAAINAIKGLQSQAGIGTPVTSVQGMTGSQAAMLPFRDDGELMAAMKDPRYATSGSYRAEVERRASAAIKSGKVTTHNVTIHGAL